MGTNNGVRGPIPLSNKAGVCHVKDAGIARAQQHLLLTGSWVNPDPKKERQRKELRGANKIES